MERSVMSAFLFSFVTRSNLQQLQFVELLIQKNVLFKIASLLPISSIFLIFLNFIALQKKFFQFSYISKCGAEVLQK